jgi:FAD:protein FMN transferase
MIFRKHIYIIAAVIIFLASTAVFCVRSHKRTEFKMGTFIEIYLTGFIWDNFDLAFKNAFSAIDKIEIIANTYDDKSEIGMLNKTLHDKMFVASEDLFFLIDSSKILYNQSNGVFDVTIAPLSRLWKPYIKKKIMPDTKEITEALKLVGSDKIRLDEASRSIRFLKKGMELDLSAIAKGYAVDKAIDEIKKLNFRSAMVNAGGDIFCLGRRAFIFPWRIGIKDPKDRDRIFKVINACNRAVATSGGYEQFFLHDGKYYSHLIDPRTGYPADNTFLSVTVIADRCFIADAIATAIFVGGQNAKDKLKVIYPDIDVITIEQDKFVL